MPNPLPPAAPALITGGSSGIGLAMARIFVASGRPVAIMGRDSAKLREAEAGLKQGHPAAGVLGLRGDVGQPLDISRAVDATVDAFGPLGIAVANAGIARPGHFVDQPLGDHVSQMQTNYFGSLHLARAAVPAFGPGGRLVFVSSGAALIGIHGYAAYAPSKYAVRGLAEVLRVELAALGISVTVAFPPDTETPQLHEEALTKPASTKRFTEGSGIFSADKVAGDIIRAALKGQFQVTTGTAIGVLMRLQDLLGPYLRWEQRRAIAAEAKIAAQSAKTERIEPTV
jgi:3-dehydrosphinganine reductase